MQNQHFLIFKYWGQHTGQFAARRVASWLFAGEGRHIGSGYRGCSWLFAREGRHIGSGYRGCKLVVCRRGPAYRQWLQGLQVGCLQERAGIQAVALKYLIRWGGQKLRVTIYTVTTATSHCLLHWTTNLQTSVPWNWESGLIKWQTKHDWCCAYSAKTQYPLLLDPILGWVRLKLILVSSKDHGFTTLPIVIMLVVPTLLCNNFYKNWLSQVSVYTANCSSPLNWKVSFPGPGYTWQLVGLPGRNLPYHHCITHSLHNHNNFYKNWLSEESVNTANCSSSALPA